MKYVKNCPAVAKRSTFWNVERVKRGLTYPQISVHMKSSCGISKHPSGYGRIFVGIDMPDTNTIAELCRWFSELGDEIPFEVGKDEFYKAHISYKAENPKTTVVKYDNIKEVDSGMRIKEHKGGPRCSTAIGKLIQNNGYSMPEIANKIGVNVHTFKDYVRGKTKVTDDVVIDVTEVLNNDPENIERLFNEAYDQYHIDPKQITVDDIPKEKPEEPEQTAVEDTPEEGPCPDDVRPITGEHKVSLTIVNIDEKFIPLFDYIIKWTTEPNLKDMLELMDILSASVINAFDLLYWAYQHTSWGGYAHIVAYLTKNEYYYNHIIKNVLESKY
jgi:plasmid maintenance system antidote protein VapI